MGVTGYSITAKMNKMCHRVIIKNLQQKDLVANDIHTDSVAILEMTLQVYQPCKSGQLNLGLEWRISKMTQVYIVDATVA